MNLKRITSAAAAALVAATIAALAANTTFFTSIGDLIFPFSPPTASAPGTIDNMTIGATTPQNGTFKTVTATQVLAALGSYANNPASATYYPSYTFAHGQTQMTFNIGSTTSYAYVTLEASPFDGERECVFSTVAITTLFVYANVGQTINNAVTTLAANSSVCYQYSLANTAWYRTR